MKSRTSSEIGSKRIRNFHFTFAGFLLPACVTSILYALYPAHPVWSNVFLHQGMGIAFDGFAMSRLMLRFCIIPMVWVMLVALAGTSIAGMPISCILWMLRGCAFGCTLTNLYITQGVQGMGTAALFVLPYAGASAIVYFLAVREATRFSLAILRTILKAYEPPIKIQLYCMRFLALLLMMGLIGILQCIWMKSMYCNDIG